MALAILCLQPLLGPSLSVPGYRVSGVGNANPTEALPKQGQALSYASPAQRAGAFNVDYDTFFGKDWLSIRTFRLLTPLEAPLKVYVDKAPRDARLYKPQYFSYVQESLRVWAEALDGRLRYEFTDNPAEAQIRVGWVPSFPDKYTAGEAVYKVGEAAIQIKTVGVPDKDIKANVIHEFGHALGIADHSPNQGDIMVAMRRWVTNDANYNPRLSKWDKMAIQRLYSRRWMKGEDLYAAVRQQPQADDVTIASASGGGAMAEASSIGSRAIRSFTTAVEIEPYVTAINKQVERHWKRPEGLSPQRVVLRYQIDAKGQLHQIRVYNSSGSEAMDTAAVMALKSAAPFLPFPGKLPDEGNKLTIETSFN